MSPSADVTAGPIEATPSSTRLNAQSFSSYSLMRPQGNDLISSFGLVSDMAALQKGVDIALCIDFFEAVFSHELRDEVILTF